jgi:hypothetical protein
MRTPAQRLKETRIAAGYRTATAAAEAMGVNPATYLGHENGSRGLARAMARYARFYKVSLNWLMTGTGAIRPGQGHPVAERFEALPTEKQTEVLGFIAYIESQER